jgi:hypothetical protein
VFKTIGEFWRSLATSKNGILTFENFSAINGYLQPLGLYEFKAMFWLSFYKKL